MFGQAKAAAPSVSLQLMVDEYTHGGENCASVEDATRKHFARYELQAANMPASDTDPQLACRKGCAYCCHLRVSAPAHEVFTLADQLRSLPDDTRREEITASVRQNAARIRLMTPTQHQTTPTRCAMLDDAGACQAYDARPSACRRYHSVALSDCEASFAAPHNLGSKIRLSTPHLVVSMSHYLGFRKVLEERGYDTAQYELHTALDEALDDPQGCLDRYMAGQPVFTRAVVTQAAGVIG